MNNEIEWKEGAVCYADCYQWFPYKDWQLKTDDGNLDSLDKLMRCESFQLNTIRQGDYISKSELDTEDKYNRAVDVLEDFGCQCYANYSLLKSYGNLYAEEGKEVHTCTNESGCAVRELTHNQLMAIGELKRLMNERDKLNPEEEIELKHKEMVAALSINKANYSDKPNSSDVTTADEWPKIGDKVTVFGQQGVIALPADKHGVFIVEANRGYLAPQLRDLSKPKSKEDLLIEELQTKLVNNNAVDSYILACDIVNGDIDGLVYVGDKKSDTGGE